MTTVKILNSLLRSQACCGYGDWFALDLLMELASGKRPRNAEASITRTCPSCGARVTVDWQSESVMYDAAPGAREDAP